MKRLLIGDTFWTSGLEHKPYTVTSVLYDGYRVQQKGGRVEKYDIPTIHGLFSNDHWILKRSDIFTDDSLFTL